MKFEKVKQKTRDLSDYKLGRYPTVPSVGEVEYKCCLAPDFSAARPQRTQRQIEAAHSSTATSIVYTLTPRPS